MSPLSLSACVGRLAKTDWELVIVDDGSTDSTVGQIVEESLLDARIRLVQLARNYGQSTAMQAGFDHASGDLLITMDSDLQNDPADIPVLVAKLENGYDIVAGYRIRRQDSFFTRKVPSWIANRIIAMVTGVPIKDNGCSLKAYRRELLSRMRLLLGHAPVHSCVGGCDGRSTVRSGARPPSCPAPWGEQVWVVQSFQSTSGSGHD